MFIFLNTSIYADICGFRCIWAYIWSRPTSLLPPQGKSPKTPRELRKTAKCSEILARCYSTYHQHCILNCKAAKEVGENAKQQQKHQMIL